MSTLRSKLASALLWLLSTTPVTAAGPYVVIVTPIVADDQTAEFEQLRHWTIPGLNGAVKNLRALLDGSVELVLEPAEDSNGGYALTDIKVLPISEDIYLRAVYRLPGGKAYRVFTARYPRAPPPSYDDVVGELIEASVLHWKYGPYRYYEIIDCKLLLQGATLKLKGASEAPAPVLVDHLSYRLNTLETGRRPVGLEVFFKTPVPHFDDPTVVDFVLGDTNEHDYKQFMRMCRGVQAESGRLLVLTLHYPKTASGSIPSNIPHLTGSPSHDEKGR